MDATDRLGAVLEIVEEELSGRTVRLSLIGELDVGSVGVLREALKPHRVRQHAVVIDLSALEFMDSSGLHLLLDASCDARRDGWNLALDPLVSAPVDRVLELSGIRGLLEWTA